MMFTHSLQAEKRSPVPLGEIDRTPQIYNLFVAEKLSPRVASALVGWGQVGSIGAACRRGRRWMLGLPGIGPAGLREVEEVARNLGIEVRP